MGLLRLVAGIVSALCTIEVAGLTFNVPNDPNALPSFHALILVLCVVGFLGLVGVGVADYRIGVQRDSQDYERDRRERERDERENARDERGKKRDEMIESLVSNLASQAPPGDRKALLVPAVGYIQRLWGFIRQRDEAYDRGMREKAPLREDLHTQLSDEFFKASKAQFDAEFRHELDALLPRLRSAGIDTSEAEKYLAGAGEPLSAYVENIAYAVDDLVKDLINVVYGSPAG